MSNQIAKHGKDIADGDGQALGSMTKGSFSDDYGGGSQSLARHLAHKHPRPRTERHTIYFGSRGLYATTMYVYLFFAEDSMDESIVNTEVGYKDSSLDHYYRSRGLTQITARLTRRLRVCGCQPCLRLDFENCELVPTNTRLGAGTTPRGFNVILHPARPSPEARHTRNARNPLPEFCQQIAVRDNIIVRQAEEERLENPGEEWFVAKVEEKPRKLDEAGVYAAVHYSKGDWIVFVRWYVFDASKKNDDGDRFYTKGGLQWIPCGSIVRGLRSDVKLHWNG